MQLGSHGVAVSSLCVLRVKIPRAPLSPTQTDLVRLHAPILMRLRMDYGATFVSVDSCDRGVSFACPTLSLAESRLSARKQLDLTTVRQVRGPSLAKVALSAPSPLHTGC